MITSPGTSLEQALHVETGDASVVLFDYDSGGRVQGYRIATDRETVDRCREQYDLALSQSVPLGEFVAASLHL